MIFATNNLLVFMNIHSDRVEIIAYTYFSVILIAVYWCTFILILLYEYIHVTNFVMVVMIIFFILMSMLGDGSGYNLIAAFLFAVFSPSLLFQWLILLSKEFLKYRDIELSKMVKWSIIVITFAIILPIFYVVYSWFIWDVIFEL